MVNMHIQNNPDSVSFGRVCWPLLPLALSLLKLYPKQESRLGWLEVSWGLPMLAVYSKYLYKYQRAWGQVVTQGSQRDYRGGSKGRNLKLSWVVMQSSKVLKRLCIIKMILMYFGWHNSLIIDSQSQIFLHLGFSVTYELFAQLNLS